MKKLIEDFELETDDHFIPSPDKEKHPELEFWSICVVIMALTRDKHRVSRKRLMDVVEAGLNDVVDSHSAALEDTMEKYNDVIKKQKLASQMSLNT